MQELINRPRRLRMSRVLRDMVAEARLDSRMLVQPHFVVPGSSISEPIGAMPGIDHQSVDRLVETVGADLDLGINAVLLFGVPDANDKSPDGRGAAVWTDGMYPWAMASTSLPSEVTTVETGMEMTPGTASGPVDGGMTRSSVPSTLHSVTPTAE